MSSILDVGRVIIAGLRVQIGVADIKEGTATHDVQITIMQLLHNRRLEALTPTQSEAEIINRQHGTRLGCQTEAEVLVIYQTESYGHVQPFQHVELILHIECGRPVAGRSHLSTFRGFQIVIAIFCSSIQRVFVRQVEDALQLPHESLLVALQLTLSWLHQHRIPLAVQVAILLSFQQHIIVGAFGVVVIISMFVPVNVEGDIAPFAAYRSRRIIVAQVVGIDVAAGMGAIHRTTDILLV